MEPKAWLLEFKTSAALKRVIMDFWQSSRLQHLGSPANHIGEFQMDALNSQRVNWLKRRKSSNRRNTTDSDGPFCTRTDRSGDSDDTMEDASSGKSYTPSSHLQQKQYKESLKHQSNILSSILKTMNSDHLQFYS